MFSLSSHTLPCVLRDINIYGCLVCALRQTKYVSTSVVTDRNKQNCSFSEIMTLPLLASFDSVTL